MYALPSEPSTNIAFNTWFQRIVVSVELQFMRRFVELVADPKVVFPAVVVDRFVLVAPLILHAAATPPFV